ncbi:MAG: ComEA family DNA-binding protein [Oscillospiraceae bacterium]|nr:ComEA family DNA-binding protein [Oscillospiraceae bacterium]
MKKDSATILITATLVFAALVIGVLIGRYTGRSPVPVQKPSVETTQSYNLDPVQDSAQNNTQKLNINTATQEQFDALPGIGSVLAARIVAYRDANGPFTSISELTNVSGIGQERLKAIMELITLD